MKELQTIMPNIPANWGNLGKDSFPIVVEVDGKRETFDAFYDEETFGFPQLGAWYGCNETTKPKDSMRNYLPTSAVWCLSAYRKNADGSFFGIQGLFRNGIWTTDENDNPMMKVWDRII